MSETMFLPPFPVAAIAAAALVLLALAAARALRERSLAAIPRQRLALAARLLVLAGILWIALNPTRVRSRPVEGRPRLAVLVDASASMAARDVDGKTRLAAALEVLGDAGTRKRLEADFSLDVRVFDKDLRPAALGSLGPDSAKGRATDIGGALSAAVADLAGPGPQAGVLLVSDGRATTPGAEDAAGLALARSVPVWTWCLGGPVARREVWIEAPASEVLAFSGAEVEIAATVRQVGLDDRTFAVEAVAGERVVGRAEVAPGPAGEGPVRFKVRAPEKGEDRIALRVIEDEADPARRSRERSVFLRSVGAKVRVLVAEGQPHWDTKFLVQSLKASPHVDLTALYRLGKDRQFAVVSSEGKQRREEKDLFPRTAEAFAAFDVIILGRECDAFFDGGTEKLLTDFVAQGGGGLVFARGKGYGGRFPALSKLEPVVWGTGAASAVRLVPGRPGGDSPILELAPAGEVEALLDRLPRFDAILQTVGVKPLAVVLAGGAPEGSAGAGGGAAGAPGGDEPPVILASQIYGQGRAVTVNAGGLWRWAFRVKGRDEDEDVYDRFWLGLIRWILSSGDFGAGSDVALRSDRRLYTDEQPLRLLVRARRGERAGFRPRLEVRGPGVAAEVEPRMQSEGVFLAEAGPFPPGSYDVRLAGGAAGAPALAVEVVSGSIEDRVPGADPELMERIARTSEGRVLAAGDVARLGEIVRSWRARRQLADEKESAWDRAWILAALVAALGAEWLLRRREGLL